MNKKRNDVLLIAVLIVLSLSALVVFGLCKKSGQSVSVLVDGKEMYSLPLNKDSQTEIKSKNGSNTLVIQNGCAYITDASCPDKICQKHQKISRSGETIVCLPNRVTVRVTSQTANGLDATV